MFSILNMILLGLLLVTLIINIINLQHTIKLDNQSKEYQKWRKREQATSIIQEIITYLLILVISFNLAFKVIDNLFFLITFLTFTIIIGLTSIIIKIKLLNKENETKQLLLFQLTISLIYMVCPMLLVILNILENS